MKKLFLLIMISMVFILSSCSGKVYSYNQDNIEAFDLLIENKLNGLYSQALAYDLRENCDLGHIEGFSCIRVAESGLTKEDIINMILSYDLEAVIILICNDGVESSQIAKYLKKEKYKSVHYFEGGYISYCEIKGDSFIPEIGCDC